MLSTTAFLALAVQCAASIHPSTSLDVARVESGFHPYAIAEILPDSRGVISHFPTSLPEAIRLTGRLAARGRRYSVGLMQITSSNFRHYDVNARDLLDPCVNLSIFERILTDCYQRSGTLKRALSCYYSGNFETGLRSESAFNQTSYVQRIGYAVPSTQEDRPRASDRNAPLPVHYPAVVLRGEPADASRAVLTSLHYPNTVIRGTVPVAIHEEK
ncbi:TPA_asm: lytic transglycosylase domain-containing protein [Salmonella enterica subsp. enterica serovar Senftenberg]|uniref:Lytic transglycosylase domain-containing protein n=1 Tax=Salmonella senftenberg TaxID=28150 RepID=A0A725F4V8_SALSE|nr:lytic transglycosylase domain-containing protein [Klebsiella pneumoniae]EIX9581431.1 lytic transglycosylase domain-containing protein [Klebsiella pneumoniae]RRE99239.1 transglycosylase [Klebsiella pneumoniae]HAE0720611.1 lytic transglycosylase domain-containing protein [Salmonella enterica subsp. enterica serovar Senftenberg]HCI5167235.1 lytic transglycosylase domain-containing protein [Klebsiella pneumoniae]